jgi:hypothetical protein
MCPNDVTAFRDYQRRWRDRLSEVPYIDVNGLHPLTPDQRTVGENQKASENQWVLHPNIDGCEPAAKPPDISLP